MSERGQILLTDAFKSKVFAALKAGEPRQAQQLCFELAKENEDHAKQIYSHLLKTARKRGWVKGKSKSSSASASGDHYGSGHSGSLDLLSESRVSPGVVEVTPGVVEVTPVEVTPVEVVPVEVVPVEVAPQSGSYDPGGALPVPQGMFGDPGGALPVPQGMFGDPGGALPVPQDLLGSGALPVDPSFGGAAYGQPMGYAPEDAAYPAHDDAAYAQPGYAPDDGYPEEAYSSEAYPQEAYPQEAYPQEAYPSGPAATPPGGSARPDFSPEGAAVGGFSPAGGYPIPAGVQIPQHGDDPPERGFLARVSAEGRAARVRLLLQAGQLPSARALAENARTHAPFSAQAHAAVGAVLLNEGDAAQALTVYTQAVRADPQDRLAVRGYAAALRALGRHREAAEALKRIVSPTEGTLTDLYALDASLRQAGDAAAAERVRQVASSREVAGVEALHKQVQQQVAAGNPVGAASALLELVAHLEPPYRSAVELATQLMQRGPDLALARGCAEVYLRADRPWLAVRALHRVGAANAADPQARRLLGRAYLALGAGSLAEEQLLVAAQAGHGEAEDFVALGEAYLDRGDPEGSARAFAQALEAKSDQAQVHHRLANALALAGDLEGAVRALERAQQLAGAEAGAQDALDRITEHANDGRIRSARARLALDPRDVVARLDLAEALAVRGDSDEALRLLRASLGDPAHRERVRELCQRLDGHGDRDLALLLSQLHSEDGEARAAVQALEECADEAPRDIELQLAYCRALSAAKRWQAACDRLAEVLPNASRCELVPALECAEALLGAGLDRRLVFATARGLQRVQREAEAEAWLARYAAEHEDEHADDLEVAEFRADLLEAKGDPAAALRVFQPLAEAPAAPLRVVERAGLLAL
ncbi:MAG: tetratricopeptide repeat protein, partial [Planctomycetes bacterium]|nr:tetratricopeptide repeat protein [Planctomycetota bacterium]